MSKLLGKKMKLSRFNLIVSHYFVKVSRYNVIASPVFFFWAFDPQKPQTRVVHWMFWFMDNPLCPNSRHHVVRSLTSGDQNGHIESFGSQMAYFGGAASSLRNPIANWLSKRHHIWLVHSKCSGQRVHPISLSLPIENKSVFFFPP